MRKPMICMAIAVMPSSSYPVTYPWIAAPVVGLAKPVHGLTSCAAAVVMRANMLHKPGQGAAKHGLDA